MPRPITSVTHIRSYNGNKVPVFSDKFLKADILCISDHQNTTNIGGMYLELRPRPNKQIRFGRPSIVRWSRNRVDSFSVPKHHTNLVHSIIMQHLVTIWGEGWYVCFFCHINPIILEADICDRYSFSRLGKATFCHILLHLHNSVVVKCKRRYELLFRFEGSVVTEDVC